MSASANRGTMSVSEAGKKGGIARGKYLAGSGNPNAKIDEEMAEHIRLAKGLISAEELSELIGIHCEQIRKIWRGVHWQQETKCLKEM